MKYIIFVFFLFFCGSCSSDQAKSVDGLILIDPNTQKKYMLRLSWGEVFFVDEYVQVISGKDTTFIFRHTNR